ncbi:hypothetical protein ACFPOD_05135 [Nitratireductor kimnyeongensis]|uniref:Uncharacterized protein n=1 Tax=Nitratireductor kimnyeongensis TaxID=430679 RepID=A0ABW0T560_9HYPH|nr:hypothetical protein [Nitratireductor kimnyeongensis]QZZ34533.1 hypothetical protein KW403_12065 [Nitratireductor kimnyeongensis]
MSARDVILSACKTFDLDQGELSLRFPEHVEKALTSSGYRILAPGEMDRETLEAAAKVARKEAFNAISGAVVCHGEMTHREMESDADDIAAAIRALGGKQT